MGTQKKNTTPKEDELSKTIANELRALRTEYVNDNNTGIDYAKLSLSLFEKEGKNISADSLKNYEACDKGKSRFGSNLGMSVDTLVALADFYRVTVQSILGREELRLSAPALRNIQRLLSTPYSDSLNALLSSSAMIDILREIDYARRENAKLADEILRGDYTDDKLSEINYRMRHTQRDVAEGIEQLIHSLCRFGTVENAVKHKKDEIQKANEIPDWGDA